MSLLLNVIVAAAVIAGLLLLRLAADRAVLRSRVRGAAQPPADCSRIGCHGPCDSEGPTARAGSAGDDNDRNGSAHHAP